MKKMLITVLVCVMMLLVVLPSSAQGDSNKSYDISGFRPLGRFTINANNITYSPNGFYVAGIINQTRPATAEEIETLDLVPTEETEPPTEGDEGDPNAEDATAEATEDAAPVMVQTLNLHLWDIRGGNDLWSFELPLNRVLEGIVFSPASDLLYVRTNRPYPSEEEVRLTFVDVKTGQQISETGDIDVINTPIVAGDMPQELYASPYFTADGQHVIVNYQRRIEAMRCAVWNVDSGRIVWQEIMACGALNTDGRYLIVKEPHSNVNSAYHQLAVYSVERGERLAVSEDEVIDFRWIDATHVMLQRPYGDAPVIWDVQSNTRAVLQTPFRSEVFWVIALPDDVLAYARNGITYVWDQSSGRLLREIPATGAFLEQDNQVILVQINNEWYQDEQIRDDGLKALDFETGNELWHGRWQHELNDLSPDGRVALAFDQVVNTVDVFDLTTGKQFGSIGVESESYYMTDDWAWLVETAYNTFTVWGQASEVSLFANPPAVRTKTATDVYFDPSTTYDPARQFEPNTYLWIIARTEDSEWFMMETSAGRRYWVSALDVELLVDKESIPVDPY